MIFNQSGGGGGNDDKTLEYYGVSENDRILVHGVPSVSTQNNYYVPLAIKKDDGVYVYNSSEGSSSVYFWEYKFKNGVYTYMHDNVCVSSQAYNGYFYQDKDGNIMAAGIEGGDLYIMKINQDYTITAINSLTGTYVEEGGCFYANEKLYINLYTTNSRNIYTFDGRTFTKLGVSGKSGGRKDDFWEYNGGIYCTADYTPLDKFYRFDTSSNVWTDMKFPTSINHNYQIGSCPPVDGKYVYILSYNGDFGNYCYRFDLEDMSFKKKAINILSNITYCFGGSSNMFLDGKYLVWTDMHYNDDFYNAVFLIKVKGGKKYE